MIKLVDLFNESFPASIENRMIHFKNHLKPGLIILKNWPHSHVDELHMYLDDKIDNNTTDYSNDADSHVTVRTMKIGEVVHDQHFGIVVDFALDDATLIPTVVTLDSEWRFLKNDEKNSLRKFLQKKISDPAQQNNSNETDKNQTCQQVIEKHSNHKIVF